MVQIAHLAQDDWRLRLRLLVLATPAIITYTQFIKLVQQVAVPVTLDFVIRAIGHAFVGSQDFKPLSCLLSQLTFDLWEVLAHNVKVVFLQQNDDAERLSLHIVLSATFGQDGNLSEESTLFQLACDVLFVLCQQ